VFADHQAAYLMSRGRLKEAKSVLEAAREAHPSRMRRSRVACRALATLGEIYRRLGDRDAAEAMLTQAARSQAAGRYLGEMTDLTQPYQAKLETNPDRTIELLNHSKRFQREHHNRVGEVRTLLLKARLLPDADKSPLRTRIEHLRSQRPALSQCTLLSAILGNWEQWTTGGPPPRGVLNDDFWGV
jgi:hypothetical protein